MISPAHAARALVLLAGLLLACGREGPEATAPRAPAEAASPAVAAAAEWVVDPKDPGPSLPPVGRSLFDFVVSGPGGPGTVPFPFTELTRLLEGRLAGAEARAPVKLALLPLNRSLQRNAARPDFFFYPRVVMAVDGEGAPSAARAPLLLRDRLFAGYQEKAGIIEVISYNEAAGRFEFQVVKDYRPGQTPRVFYANRAICVVCHQNHAPIFSRQLWDETGANPRVAALLRAQGRPFYGVPLDQGVDIPYGIDNATDRANGFAAYQRIWQDGCDQTVTAAAIECRAGLFTLALQYRLSGARQVDTRSPRFRDDLLPGLARRWRERWPRGLAVPDPDIPNRDPLTELADVAGAEPVSLTVTDRRLRQALQQVGVHSRFEPSNPRAPLEIWPLADHAPDALERAIAGLGAFLAAADIRRLDEHLFARAEGKAARLTSRESPCELELLRRDEDRRRLTFRCAADGGGGSTSLDGVAYVESGRVVAGSIERALIADGDELRDLDVVAGWARSVAAELTAELQVVQRSARLHARGADGSAVRRITVRGQAPRPGTGDGDRRAFPGTATILLADDFTPVTAAVARMARRTASGALDVFGAKPFRRASLMAALERELGMASPLEWCCVDGGSLPPARLDADSPPPPPPASGAGDPEARAVALFQRYCAQCHRTRDSFPPNFLAGPPGEVRAKLAQCAERIFVRVKMWELGPAARVKTPMPPVYALHRYHISPDQWPQHPDLAALRDHAGEILRSQTGRDPRLEDLMARHYEHLRGCLPAAAKR